MSPALEAIVCNKRRGQFGNANNYGGNEKKKGNAKVAIKWVLLHPVAAPIAHLFSTTLSFTSVDGSTFFISHFNNFSFHDILF